MSESALKEEFRLLVDQAVLQVAESDLALEYFRHAIADYDTRRDEIITSLPAFESAALTILGSLTIVRERYGDDKYTWRRLTLQFVYGFLGNLSEPTFNMSSFETTWEAF